MCLARRVRPSRPALACSSPYSIKLNLVLTHGIPPDFRGGVHLFIPIYAIGSVPSLSGHAIAYRWRSLPRVRRHMTSSSPQSSSSNGSRLYITMDQSINMHLFFPTPTILVLRGQGNIHFPCSADHEQDWRPYPVDPFSAICDDQHRRKKVGENPV